MKKAAWIALGFLTVLFQANLQASTEGKIKAPEVQLEAKLNIEALAFYTGYAFCQAVNVQNVIEADALMVPFVVHWKGFQPTAIPYSAPTQAEAVALAMSAREHQSSEFTGWSFGRDGLVTLSNGSKHDVLLIEASVPGIQEPIMLYQLYKQKPFTLVEHFNFQNHPQIRRTQEENAEFMVYFRRGLVSHPFGEKCLHAVENTKSL